MMNLHILALETSSSVCGVAMLTRTDAGKHVRTLSHDGTGEHAERLLPMVDQLLSEAGLARHELTAVGFGQGPGGFTGLRVACGVAQGLGFALGIPVIPVVSLLAVAARDLAEIPGMSSIRVVMQDARMHEVYLAAYQPLQAAGSLSWRELQSPVLLSLSDAAAWMQHACARWRTEFPAAQVVRVAGDALDTYPELRSLLADLDAPQSLQLGAALRADAGSIAELAYAAWQRGLWVQPELAAPLYVRDKVAYTTLERKHGQGGNPKAAAAVTLDIMGEADLDAVAAIERSVQAFPWTRANFVDGLKAGYGAWVARQGTAIVGFCMVMFAPDVAHVLVIAVAPTEQKKGIGALLLRHCETLAKVRGLPSLVLEVRPSNLNAVGFYQRQGFVSLGMRKDYYPAAGGRREDAWVMEKKLTTELKHD